MKMTVLKDRLIVKEVEFKLPTFDELFKELLEFNLHVHGRYNDFEDCETYTFKGLSHFITWREGDLGDLKVIRIDNPETAICKCSNCGAVYISAVGRQCAACYGGTMQKIKLGD